MIALAPFEFEGELPKNLHDFFREQNRKKNLRVGEDIKDVKFVVKAEENRQSSSYLSGEMYLKEVVDSFDYSIDGFKATKEDKQVEIAQEVAFMIFPKKGIIGFTNKWSAKEYGLFVLGTVLFGDKTRIKPIIFDPNKILKAKKAGIFRNVWFNGCKGNSYITFKGQWGEEIDKDKEFENNPVYRSGIGVEAKVFGKWRKVTIHKSGSIVYLGEVFSHKDAMEIREELLRIFLPYRL